ncbi:RidA family protein [Lysobacter capsici]|jgi:enamine deaminase RidA (YjgF/YER057c/UK114 family)|uniref:RidA family protein n=1 Tax=Lysobacter capsici TaxID=435897 RepID=UPI00069C46E3|nr:RidA family protein [Lysobacter capsici]ALN87750.1 endoribonuclease L-PSP family protein [Lysobacter capsici]ATE73488.1 endonuclease [Lysobacter capsici]UOF14123.1 RidA family protein [Lysobacter capsici]
MNGFERATREPVRRHDFDDGDHAQGPQSGDRLLSSGGVLPFLVGATVPAGRPLLLLSGHTPPVIDRDAPADSIAAFGDTHAQTDGCLRELERSLRRLGLEMGDLVQLRVYVVGDPALGGRMDNEGFSRAYARWFGTPEQPHRVARTRVQVVGLVNPGWLVEIEAIAAA